MSLFGMMRTGVSGMNAQSNRLSAVADNISNSSTIGYKRAQTQFSSLVLPNTGGQYNSGSIQTNVRFGISEQGGIRSTSSKTDLAIDGKGYFLVQGADGSSFLTRAGSFVPDKNGNLVNSAGYYLLGASPDTRAGTLTSAGLDIININSNALPPVASTAGNFTVNLPADAKVSSGDEFNHKTSLVSYNDKGEIIKLDVQFAKTGADTWNVTVKNAADGAVISGPSTLTFDPGSGALNSGGVIDVNLEKYGGKNIKLDLGASTQRAGEYKPVEARINGNAPSVISDVQVANDGSVVGIYDNGTQKVLARIALASVPSPDRMTVVSGNVFLLSAESGQLELGFPQRTGLGKILSQSLEDSNADIAQELTDMIEAQRNYTANSKAFQTGSELMDVLINLKR